MLEFLKLWATLPTYRPNGWYILSPVLHIRVLRKRRESPGGGLAACPLVLCVFASLAMGVRAFAQEADDDYPIIGAAPAFSLSGSSSSPSTTLYPLTVPDYHSDPGLGEPLHQFHRRLCAVLGHLHAGHISAYDTDGDPSTFSQTELNNIAQIWSGVAEKYSPFNIDVTTQKPADLSPGKTMQIDVGGSGSWIGLAGGVSYVGPFLMVRNFLCLSR